MSDDELYNGKNKQHVKKHSKHRDSKHKKHQHSCSEDDNRNTFLHREKVNRETCDYMDGKRVKNDHQRKHKSKRQSEERKLKQHDEKPEVSEHIAQNQMIGNRERNRTVERDEPQCRKRERRSTDRTTNIKYQNGEEYNDRTSRSKNEDGFTHSEEHKDNHKQHTRRKPREEKKQGRVMVTNELHGNELHGNELHGNEENKKMSIEYTVKKGKEEISEVNKIKTTALNLTDRRSRKEHVSKSYERDKIKKQCEPKQINFRELELPEAKLHQREVERIARRMSKFQEENKHLDKNSSIEKEDLLSDVSIHCHKLKTTDKSTKHQQKYNKEHKRKLKDIRNKKSKQKTKKQKQTRLCYSDSELENVNKRTKKKSKHNIPTKLSESFESMCMLKDNGDKPINIDALYNLFYRETDVHNESQVIKEAIKKKMYPDINNSSPKQIKRNAVINTLKPVMVDQSNVRCKLIKVLFNRVKDLMKETEELRADRKLLQVKISDLSNQVETLKKHEQEQSVKEKNIEERLELLADDMKVTSQGTSFREEVQAILHNIKHKYQSHWKEHENKIQQVQTDAETEIQSLMKNIMGKCMQLNELKDKNTKQSTEQTKLNILPSHLKNTQALKGDVLPLIDLERAHHLVNSNSIPNSMFLDHPTAQQCNEHREYNPKIFPNSNELLLRIAEPSLKPLTVDCSLDEHSKSSPIHNNIESSLLKHQTKTHFKYFLQSDCRDSDKLTERKHQENNVSQSRSWTSSSKENNEITKNPAQNLFSTSRYTNTIEDHNNPQKYVSQQNVTSKSKSTPSNDVSFNETTKELSANPYSLTIDAKEFWRHKLLQPKSLERIRERRNEPSKDSKRNQF